MTEPSESEKLNTAVIDAHRFAIRNQNYLEQAQRCSCFHCLTIFNSSDLTEEDFIPEDDGQGTAWCPHCGIDSIIGEESGYEITPELLQTMKDFWF